MRRRGFIPTRRKRDDATNPVQRCHHHNNKTLHLLPASTRAFRTGRATPQATRRCNCFQLRLTLSLPDVYSSTDAIKTALRAYDDYAGQKAAYPQNNGVANDLQTVAKLIIGGLPTRVYYVSLGGFDTHSDQFGRHQYLLSQLSDALAAFQEDLRLQGCADDVVTMTFSEFGRRVKENGSNGTDHGSASVLFVVGSKVKGGVVGNYPSLEDLDDGDLKMTTDFRSVYSSVLDNWLGAPSNKVLNGDFAPLRLV